MCYTQDVLSGAPQLPSHFPKCRGEVNGKVPVCLDHLKGICESKRAKCKFAHPPLDSEAARQAMLDRKVCSVYVLTGSCKFGDRCRDYHPPRDTVAAPVCEPVKTSKQLALEILGKFGDDESSIYGSETASLSTEDGESVGILNKLAPARFAGQLEDILRRLGDQELSLPCFVSALVKRGVNEDLHRPLYAELLFHLKPNLLEHQQTELLFLLNKLVGKYIYTETSYETSDESEEAQQHKQERVGAIRFMVQLWTRGLFRADFLFTKFDFLLGEALANNLNASLLAEGLKLTTPILDKDPSGIDKMRVDHYIAGLRELASKLTPRVNVLVDILVEKRATPTTEK
eukprot:TRINITY_DN1142_c0_g1_i1.p1 TRINITY_DN1142_c0_g1~~TRINITY_DN1142_c0_g1_i1.p1  ORF type:complete len:344 (-),score=67.58 TRINITY_DN1142_c0_g1_i1:493-1524(-)